MPVDNITTEQTKHATSIADGDLKESAGEKRFLRIPAGPLKDIALSPFVHVAIIIGIVAYCFGRTLGSYFLADDFGEICYVNRIFNGEWGLLWSNFTGNFMQIPSMNVYRPMLLITLVSDYLVWHANAFGYYLTNILYFTGDCLLIYALVRQLTSSWSPVRSCLASFFSAALFASYPLHCESISWVVGRVDIACCFYYLLSLCMLLRYRQSSNKLWMAACIASFVLGLTTKEMAIGLPVMAAAIGFFFTGDTKLRNRLRDAFSLSWPIWAATGVYFVIRYLALGTLTGGYTGGIGATQLGAIVQKWTDADTIRRLNFPFNYSVFHDAGIYPRLLTAIYFVPALSLAVRLLGRAVPWSWLFFCAIWLASAAVPIYQLWGLGYNLEGSRFFFFFSVPLCVLTAVLAFSPAGQKSLISGQLSGRLALVNAVAFGLLVVLFTRIAYYNNIPWVHAGKTVRSVQEQAQKLADSLPTNKKAIVLGIPKDEGGAHMILNGATFGMMMSPPFLNSSSAQRFLTFDPILFGDPDIINAARLKQSLKDPAVTGIYSWDQSNGRFVKTDISGTTPVSEDSAEHVGALGVSLFGLGQPPWKPSTASGTTYSSRNGALLIDHAVAGDGISADGLNINPLGTDFLELRLRHTVADAGASVVVSWHGAQCDGHTASVAAPVTNSSSEVTLLVPLSRYWRWYAAGSIKELTVSLRGFHLVELTTANLVPDKQVSPSLSVKEATISNRGVIEPVAADATLEVDGSGIPGAVSTSIEISRPNFFFEHFVGQPIRTAVLTTQQIATVRGFRMLKTIKFPEHAYYQIRARSLDKKGQPIGEYSDPITINF